MNDDAYYHMLNRGKIKQLNNKIYQLEKRIEELEKRKENKWVKL